MFGISAVKKCFGNQRNNTRKDETTSNNTDSPKKLFNPKKPKIKLGSLDKMFENATPEFVATYITPANLNLLQQKHAQFLANVNRYINLSTKPVELNDNEAEELNNLVDAIYTDIQNAMLANTQGSSGKKQSKQLDRAMFILAKASGFKGEERKDIQNFDTHNATNIAHPYKKLIVNLIASLNTHKKLSDALASNLNFSLTVLKQNEPEFFNLLRVVSSSNSRFNNELYNLKKSINDYNCFSSKEISLLNSAIIGSAAAVAGGAIAAGVVLHGIEQTAIIDNYLNSNETLDAKYNNQGFHTGVIEPNPDYDNLINSYHNPVSGKDYEMDTTKNNDLQLLAYDKNSGKYYKVSPTTTNGNQTYVEIDLKTQKEVENGEVVFHDIDSGNGSTDKNPRIDSFEEIKYDTSDGTIHGSDYNKDQYIQIDPKTGKAISGGEKLPSKIETNTNGKIEIRDNPATSKFFENKLDPKTGKHFDITISQQENTPYLRELDAKNGKPIEDGERIYEKTIKTTDDITPNTIIIDNASGQPLANFSQLIDSEQIKEKSGAAAFATSVGVAGIAGVTGASPFFSLKRLIQRNYLSSDNIKLKFAPAKVEKIRDRELDINNVMAVINDAAAAPVDVVEIDENGRVEAPNAEEPDLQNNQVVASNSNSNTSIPDALPIPSSLIPQSPNTSAKAFSPTDASKAALDNQELQRALSNLQNKSSMES